MRNTPTSIIETSLSYLNQLNFSIIEKINIKQNASLDNIHQQILCLWTNIFGLLHKQADKNNEVYNILFALAAYTDEIAFALPNQQRLTWSKHCLQRKYFNSQQAGIEFFQKLDYALKENHTDCITIYLLCMQFGFAGKYKNSGSKHRLSDVKSIDIDRLSDRTSSAGHQNKTDGLNRIIQKAILHLGHKKPCSQQPTSIDSNIEQSTAPSKTIWAFLTITCLFIAISCFDNRLEALRQLTMLKSSSFVSHPTPNNIKTPGMEG